MHLISTLASGVKGAESGTAEIYARGTQTRATYYTDFEAGTSVTTGANVALDANGGAEIYVNQYVDVVVKNSSGTTIREFTEGKAAPNVEYIGSSFTGVDYTTGASAVNKPVNLQTILNLWNTSAGAADFNVLLEGSAATIQAALGTVSGYFFNVQSAAYGAEGDGTTDDTTAINAAIAAATASGGIVFFPAGTYRVTSSLSLPADVSFLGLGSDISIITMDHASNNLLVLSGGSSGGFQEIKGIGFTAAQLYSGLLLYGATAETFAVFNGCSFGGANTTDTIISIDIDHAVVKFNHCWFYPEKVPNTDHAIYIGSSGTDEDMAWYGFSGCRFQFSATQTAVTCDMIRAESCHIDGCRFDASLMTTAATLTFVDFYGTAVSDIQAVSATNNYFIGSATATVQAFDIASGNIHVHESGNHFSDDITLYGTSEESKGGTTQFIHYGSRENRYNALGTDNSASIRLNTLDYGLFDLTRSDATALTLTADLMPLGSWFSMCIHNSNGGAATGNITLSSSDFNEDVGAFTVAASSRRFLTFRMMPNGSGTDLWCLVEITGDI